jgi:undecaprenyl-diphosphatase
VPFIAGAARMRPLPLLAWAVVSGLLWGVAYPGIGYLGGSSWELASNLSGGFGIVILLAAAAVAYGLFRRHLARRPKPGKVSTP